MIFEISYYVDSRFNYVSNTSAFIGSHNRKNCTGCRRDQLMPNSRYYRGVCLKELKKTTKICHDIPFQFRDLDPRPSEY
jgi:hypothetical protein